MSLQLFYEIWKLLRVAALIAAGLLLLFACIFGHTFHLDIEYIGPGSEAERLDREYNDKQNERAHERVVNEGSTNERDVERARDFERDHGA